jgi:hypothetical protein
MLHPATFRDMKTAPLDGTLVEVQHGPQQAIVCAYWNKALQGWVRKGAYRRVLHQVTGWRPLKQ